MPETIISLSPCIAEVGPSCRCTEWGTTIEKQRADAIRYGLSPEEAEDCLDTLDAVIERTPVSEGLLASAAPGEVMPFGFSSFELARAFHERIQPRRLLLGIGLHHSLLPLLDEQLDQDINKGYGLVERIGQNATLESGNVLGFEPLGFYAMSFHSWLCCYYPDKVSSNLNIQPAPNGFIREFADALKVTAYIRAGKPEPGIWLPWLVVQYESGNEP